MPKPITCTNIVQQTLDQAKTDPGFKVCDDMGINNGKIVNISDLNAYETFLQTYGVKEARGLNFYSVNEYTILLENKTITTTEEYMKTTLEKVCRSNNCQNKGKLEAFAEKVKKTSNARLTDLITGISDFDPNASPEQNKKNAKALTSQHESFRKFVEVKNKLHALGLITYDAKMDSNIFKVNVVQKGVDEVKAIVLPKNYKTLTFSGMLKRIETANIALDLILQIASPGSKNNIKKEAYKSYQVLFTYLTNNRVLNNMHNGNGASGAKFKIDLIEKFVKLYNEFKETFSQATDKSKTFSDMAYKKMADYLILLIQSSAEHKDKEISKNFITGQIQPLKNYLAFISDNKLSPLKKDVLFDDIRDLIMAIHDKNKSKIKKSVVSISNSLRLSNADEKKLYAAAVK